MSSRSTVSTLTALGLTIFAYASCTTSVAKSATSTSSQPIVSVDTPQQQTVNTVVTNNNAKEPVVEVAANAKPKGFLGNLGQTLTTKKNDYQHLSPVKQTWYKCTKKDSDLFVVPFPYEQYMCYRYCDRSDMAGGACDKWVIKRYHFVTDHQIMIDRGAWIVK